MRNFVQPGDTLTLTAPRAIASGAAILVGSIFGVATAAAASGANVETLTKGVFDLPKATGAVTQGQKVYWDNAAFNVTATSTNNTLIGVATQAAASADATARVKLNQSVAA